MRAKEGFHKELNIFVIHSWVCENIIPKEVLSSCATMEKAIGQN